MLVPIGLKRVLHLLSDKESTKHIYFKNGHEYCRLHDYAWRFQVKVDGFNFYEVEFYEEINEWDYRYK